MKNVIIAVLSFAIVIGGCSKNNGLTNNLYEELRVTATVVKGSQTKAIVNDDFFPVASSIGVQLLKFSDDSPYSTKTNVMFTSDGSGNWSSAEGYILNPLKAKVYAYYPYVSLSDDTQPFYTIPASVEAKANYDSDIDYMYATPLEDFSNAPYNANSAINLQMNHALTQVSLLVYKDNYNGAGILTDFFIEDTNPGTGHILVNSDPVYFTMDIRDGSIAGGTEGIIERNLLTPLSIGQASSDPKFPADNLNELKLQVLEKGVSALLAPTSLINSGEVKFSFVIDGNTYSVVNTSSITWEGGKQNIYTIRLSGTALTISQVSVTKWEPVKADDLIIN